MKIKYVIGAVLMTAVLMLPTQAATCDCATAPNVTITCQNEGGGMGSAYSNPSGGVGPYTYYWTISGATLFGGGTTSTSSDIYYQKYNAPGYVTVTLKVTDTCGRSKTVSKSCYVSGGMPFKQASDQEEEEQPLNATVSEILEWMATFKEPGYELTFKSNSLLDGIFSENLMDLKVINIIDENGRVTLVLENDSPEGAEINREIEQR